MVRGKDGSGGHCGRELDGVVTGLGPGESNLVEWVVGRPREARRMRGEGQDPGRRPKKITTFTGAPSRRDAVLLVASVRA
jgi:hypothetical protein